MYTEQACIVVALCLCVQEEIDSNVDQGIGYSKSDLS
jgi:hypothetical protein